MNLYPTNSHFKDLAEYKLYIKTMSYEELLDISYNIDRLKYPERYREVLNELILKKPTTSVKNDTKRHVDSLSFHTYRFWRFLGRVYLLAFGSAVLASILEAIIGNYYVTSATSSILLFLIIYHQIINKYSITPHQLYFNSKFLWNNLLIGMICGVIAGSFTFLIEPGYKAPFEYFMSKSPVIFIFTPIIGLARGWPILILLAAAIEEVVFRGIIFVKAYQHFKRLIPSVLITVLFFQAIHLNRLVNFNLSLLIFSILAQTILCLLFFYRRNIYLAIAWHYSFNMIVIAFEYLKNTGLPS